MKVPVLMQHYYEHRANSSKLTFIDFISDHYKMDLNQDSDHEHHNLPFKSHECHHMTQVLLMVDFPADINMPLHNASIQAGIVKDDFYRSATCFAIWQPPQITA